MTNTTITGAKSKRGFGSMDPEKQREIARKGGQAVPDSARSFTRDPELAARAGRKGGLSVNPANRTYSKNHALAVEAGRKGGKNSHKALNAKKEKEAE